MDVVRSTLCSFCEQISPNTSYLYHHPNFLAFQDSAKSCPICAMMLEFFEPDVLDKVLDAAKDPSNYTKVIIRGSPITRNNQVKSFSELRVEIFTRGNYFYSNKKFVVNSDRGPFSERIIWRGEKEVTFEDSFSVLKEWHSNCTSEHSLCSSDSGALPTRVLAVGTEADPALRLKATQDQIGTYAALSHCWGTVQDNIKTTKNNLEEHLEKVDEERLPQTFKDAVLLVRKLEIPYLWIDSLCIIQDDKEDWEKEAGMMATVFHKAHLTLAATASEDSHGGLFFPRDPAVHLKVSGIKSSDQQVSATAYIRYPADETRSLIESPLFRRGWVLQEMVLSSRTVHFARDQLFWHCRSRITSEDGYFDAKLATTFFDLETPDKANQSWWTWVEDYSSRELTRETDKFAALAGLTKSFPSIGKPIAGLWSDDVHFGLLWCVRGPSSRSSLRGVPSWSWASVNGPVRPIIGRKSALWEDHSTHVIKHANLVDAEVKWSAAPLTSTILHASLTLRARLNIADLWAVQDQDAVTNEWSGNWNVKNLNYHRFVKLFSLMPHFSEFDDSAKDFKGHCCFDLEPPEVGSHVLCLLVSTEECTTPNCRDKKKSDDEDIKDADANTCRHETSHILLIESTGVVDEYRRIGVGTVDGGNASTTLFHDMEEVDLTLV